MFGKRFELAFKSAEARANLLQDRFGTRAAAGFFTDPQNIAPDIAEILRVEAEDFGAETEARERRGKIIRRGGTDMAEILRDDEVRRESSQCFRIDGVQTFTAGNEFADDTVNLRRRSIVRNARADDDALVAHLRGKITFVADADDFLVEAEPKKDFRGGRQEGDNAHEKELYHNKRGIRYRQGSKSQGTLPILATKSICRGNIFCAFGRRRRDPRSNSRRFFREKGFPARGGRAPRLRAIRAA